MKTYTEEKRIRPDVLTASVYIAIAAMMLYAVICQKIYGDKGAFFSAAPLSLYLLFYCLFVFATQKAVYIMVRLRARRSQYLNAQANMERSVRVFGIASVLIGVLTILGSYSLSGKAFGAERGFFQLMIAGASIILLGGQGVLRGYLQGVGYTKPIAVADIIIAIFSMVSGIIIVEFLYHYGLRVNDLLHVDEFSAVYGSAGMMAGIFIGSLVGCILTVISYNLRKSEIASFVKSGAPRYLDNKNDVFTGIRHIMALYCTPALMVLVDQCAYVIFTRRFHEDVDYVSLFGVYAGRIVTSVGLISILCCIPFIKKWNRVMARIERDELEGARDRYKGLMRFFNVLLIPVSVFVFALSGTVQTVIFGKASETANNLMLPSSIAIFLFSFAIMFSWLLSHMGKSVIILLNVGIGWAVHVGGLILFMMIFNLGIMGVVIAALLTFLVYDVLCFLMIGKMLRYRQDHFKCVLLPGISAATSGFMAFLLNMLLVNNIGEALTFIICLVVFYAVYMLIMIVTRGIMAHELRKIPLGFIFEGLARTITHDRYYEG
ncbi:polysaccharide biosynthesis C-terminal domain-containing protein [Butyrivibrio sp. AE2032]|uniref:polysaccharide biosynthesis C-terminal domain-containing protein n=1 Tax=Butyrivibrio sp. AE2032 TaxID=1458463 RepID=UPI000555457E|nr:polysaccharide biosynthesis C-terminal domain-containing protein [Butyrivibrio sp. AE2032]